MAGNWILFCAVLWWLGKIGTEISLDTKRKNITLIFPPKWIFILCGLPKSSIALENNIAPVGTLVARYFGVQIVAFALAISILCLELLKQLTAVSILTSGFVCVIVATLVTIMTTKVWSISR